MGGQQLGNATQRASAVATATANANRSVTSSSSGTTINSTSGRAGGSVNASPSGSPQSSPAGVVVYDPSQPANSANNRLALIQQGQQAQQALDKSNQPKTTTTTSTQTDQQKADAQAQLDNQAKNFTDAYKLALVSANKTDNPDKFMADWAKSNYGINDLGAVLNGQPDTTISSTDYQALLSSASKSDNQQQFLDNWAKNQGFKDYNAFLGANPAFAPAGKNITVSLSDSVGISDNVGASVQKPLSFDDAIKAFANDPMANLSPQTKQSLLDQEAKFLANKPPTVDNSKPFSFSDAVTLLTKDPTVILPDAMKTELMNALSKTTSSSKSTTPQLIQPNSTPLKTIGGLPYIQSSDIDAIKTINATLDSKIAQSQKNIADAQKQIADAQKQLTVDYPAMVRALDPNDRGLEWWQLTEARAFAQQAQRTIDDANATLQQEQQNISSYNSQKNDAMNLLDTFQNVQSVQQKVVANNIDAQRNANNAEATREWQMIHGMNSLPPNLSAIEKTTPDYIKPISNFIGQSQQSIINQIIAQQHETQKENAQQKAYTQALDSSALPIGYLTGHEAFNAGEGTPYYSEKDEKTGYLTDKESASRLNEIAKSTMEFVGAPSDKALGKSVGEINTGNQYASSVKTDLNTVPVLAKGVMIKDGMLVRDQSALDALTNLSINNTGNSTKTSTATFYDNTPKDTIASATMKYINDNSPVGKNVTISLNDSMGISDKGQKPTSLVQPLQLGENGIPSGMAVGLITLPAIEALQKSYGFVDPDFYKQLGVIVSDVNNNPIESLQLKDSNGNVLKTIQKSPNFVNDLLSAENGLRAQGIYSASVVGQLSKTTTTTQTAPLDAKTQSDIAKTVADARAQGIKTLIATGVNDGYPVKVKVQVNQDTEDTLKQLLATAPNVNFHITGTSDTSGSKTSNTETSTQSYVMPASLLAVNPWTKSPEQVERALDVNLVQKTDLPAKMLAVSPALKSPDELITKEPTMADNMMDMLSGISTPFVNLPKDVHNTIEWAWKGFSPDYTPPKEWQSDKTYSGNLINLGLSEGAKALNMQTGKPYTADELVQETSSRPYYYIGTSIGDVALNVATFGAGKAISVLREAPKLAQVRYAISQALPSIEKTATLDENIIAHQNTIGDITNKIADLDTQIANKLNPTTAEKLLGQVDMTQKDLMKEVQPLLDKKSAYQDQISTIQNKIKDLNAQKFSIASPAQIAEDNARVTANAMNENDLASKGVSYAVDEKGIAENIKPYLATKFGGIKTQMNDLVSKIPIVKNLVEPLGESTKTPVVGDIEKIGKDVYGITFPQATETSNSSLIGAIFSLGKEGNTLTFLTRETPESVNLLRSPEIENQAIAYTIKQMREGITNPADIHAGLTKDVLPKLSDSYENIVPNFSLIKNAMKAGAKGLVDESIKNEPEYEKARRIVESYIPPPQQVGFGLEIPFEDVSKLTSLDKYGLSKMVTGENEIDYLHQVKAGDVQFMKYDYEQLLADLAKKTPMEVKEFGLGTGIKEGEEMTGFDYTASRNQPEGIWQELFNFGKKVTKPFQAPEEIGKGASANARADRLINEMQSGKDKNILEQMMKEPTEKPLTKEEIRALLKETGKRYVVEPSQPPRIIYPLATGGIYSGVGHYDVSNGMLVMTNEKDAIKSKERFEKQPTLGVGNYVTFNGFLKEKYKNALGKVFTINTEFEKQSALGTSKADEKAIADFKKRYNKDLEESGGFMFNFGHMETVKEKQTTRQGSGSTSGTKTTQKGININDIINDIMNRGGTKSRDRGNGIMPLWVLNSGLVQQHEKPQVPDFLQGFVTMQGSDTTQKQPQQVDQDLIQRQLQIQKNEFWNINDLLNTKPPKEPPVTDTGGLWPRFMLPDDSSPKSKANLNSENMIWGVGDQPLQYLGFELGVGENAINNIAKKYKLKNNEWYG